MKTQIIFLIAFFLLHFSFVRAQDTIYIPQDYSTIQQGIDAASDEDIVLVANGTYLENINFMGKAITVTSNFIFSGDTNDINNTIIDGSSPTDPDYASVVTFMSGEDTSSVISGFTITGGTGLYLTGQYSRIGGGISCYTASAKITDNKIINNTVSNADYPYGGGIAFIPSSSNAWTVIRNNTIKDNNVVADEGNPFGGGVYIGGDARVESNVIDNNYCHLLATSGKLQGGGIYAESLAANPMDTLILHNNIIQNNIVEGGDNAQGGAIVCGDFFPCPVAFFTNNTIVNNSVISNGTAYGSAMFLTNVRGDLLIQDNHIQLNSATSESASGMVIYILQPISKVKILSNLISDNWASSGIDFAWAAAIWLWDAESAYVVVDGNFIKNNTGNRAGGFYARNSNNFHLTNNVFEGNIVDFGGSAVHLFQYYTAGDEFYPDGGPSQDSPIPNRTKTGSMHPVIANNTFANNHTGEEGGAIYLSSTYDSLCPVIFNNIFWENEVSNDTGKDICHFGDEYLVINNNNIDSELILGNWEGEYNINEDPLFIDQENGNYCIDSCGSPCAGAGTDSIYINDEWYYAPDHDFTGNSRPLPEFTLPDMGAFEVDLCDDVNEFNLQSSTFNLQCYPNPTFGIVDCQFRSASWRIDCRFVSIKVYDVHGREVAAVQDEKFPAGEHVVRFDASGLPDGIYFLRVQAGSEAVTEKVVVMRAY